MEELRLAALEDRVEADLALGRHRDLVAELEALVSEHESRERLCGQLMLAEATLELLGLVRGNVQNDRSAMHQLISG